MSNIPKIEKGVKPPKGARQVYPWDAMSYGDSFVIKAPGKTNPEALATIERRARSAGQAWCAKHDRRAIVRVRIEGNGVRVWKLERAR